MEGFAMLVDSGATNQQVVDAYCMTEREIQYLKQALDTQRRVEGEINFAPSLQPTHCMALARAPEAFQVELAQRAAMGSTYIAHRFPVQFTGTYKLSTMLNLLWACLRCSTSRWV